MSKLDPHMAQKLGEFVDELDGNTAAIFAFSVPKGYDTEDDVKIHGLYCGEQDGWSCGQLIPCMGSMMHQCYKDLRAHMPSEQAAFKLAAITAGLMSRIVSLEGDDIDINKMPGVSDDDD